MASMSNQQAGHPRALANGLGRRRGEKETVARSEHKSQSGKINSDVGGSKGGYVCPSYERLVYLSTCLIGHSVEVQVKDGSVFSGIFHATNAEKDLGIILKMVSKIRTSSSGGQKPSVDSFGKAPLKTFIIPYEELVQMTAKDVSVTREDFERDLQRVKEQEIMLDSFISQNRHVDAERELGRWVPDEDDPQCPELDNIFDGHWNRGWDQFEVNETLFGVKSTFDEDLYTTKLQRGPQMREIEREATRIAREIENEETHDLHLAEEKGAQFPEHLDIDEETKYSSVFRGVDDSGYVEDEDILLDSQNIETFGDASSSVLNKSFTQLMSEKSSVGAQVPSCASSTEVQQSSMPRIAGDVHRVGSGDSSGKQSVRLLSNGPVTGSQSRIQESSYNERHAGSTHVQGVGEKIALTEEAQTLKSKDLPSSMTAKRDGSDITGTSPTYTSTSQGSNKGQEKISSLSDRTGNTTGKALGATPSYQSRGRSGSSASSTSEFGRVASVPNRGPALSPSSSLGSISSEKSTLNPHAKEFKLNPNAKSFVPSQSPLRPASPVSDGSFYFPPNLSALSQMHGMPVVGPTYSPQPVIYNPQVSPIMQSPQGYFPPNGPQYGQQMILGHPRQVVYMPAYSHDMQYKGRDF